VHARSMRLFVTWHFDHQRNKGKIVSVPSTVRTVFELANYLLRLHCSSSTDDQVSANCLQSDVELHPRLSIRGYTLLSHDLVDDVLKDGERIDVEGEPFHEEPLEQQHDLNVEVACSKLLESAKGKASSGDSQIAGCISGAQTHDFTCGHSAPYSLPKPKRARIGFVTANIRTALFSSGDTLSKTKSVSQHVAPTSDLVKSVAVTKSGEDEVEQPRKKRKCESEMADKGNMAGEEHALPNLEPSRSEVDLKLVVDMAPPEARWQYPLMDEVRRSFVGYLARAILPDTASLLLDAACKSARWNQPKGRWVPIPRKTSWMTKSPCTCKYGYGGLLVEPEPFAPWVEQAMKLCMPLCGLHDPSDWPNSCNLNLYEDGQHSVAWHADDEFLFQGKKEDCLIISLSLGATRSFDLKTIQPPIRTEHLELSSRLVHNGRNDAAILSASGT